MASFSLFVNSWSQDSDKKLSGLIFTEKYLENFSTKYYTCLQNLKKVVKGKEGVGTCFIYCTLVTFED